MLTTISIGNNFKQVKVLFVGFHFNYLGASKAPYYVKKPIIWVLYRRIF